MPAPRPPPPAFTPSNGLQAAAWPSIESILRRPLNPPRWLGWRLRALVLIVVSGLAGVLLVAHWLAAQPKFPLAMQATPSGEVRLGAADYPTLQRLEGLTLLSMAVESPDLDGRLRTQVAPVNSALLQPSGRWIMASQMRQDFDRLHQRMGELLGHWSSIGLVAQLHLQDAPAETVLIAPRGWSGLSPLFWLTSGLALLLLALGSSVLLVGPHWRNAGFVVLALCQCVQLMLMGVELNLEAFTPMWLVSLDVQLRMACDLASAAALVLMAAQQLPPGQRGWHPAKAPV